MLASAVVSLLSFRCCWFLSMCSCMPCPIVYICRSVCSSAIPCVPGTPIYRPVLVTLGSSIPNYHHAHLNPLVFKLRSSVGLFAVLLLYLRLVVAPMISWCSSGVYHRGISAPRVTSGVAVSVSFCSFCRDKTYQYNVSYRILI